MEYPIWMLMKKSLLLEQDIAEHEEEQALLHKLNTLRRMYLHLM